MNLTSSPSSEFKEALETEAAGYQVELTAQAVETLLLYYELLNEWNPRLHLVGHTSPREFAARHVLESLMLLQYLPQRARVADIGSGAGLPIIPCLIVRPDIEAVLIEASKKKAVFLREAAGKTLTSPRAVVIAERFENTAAPDVGFISCRALERFERMLPSLFKWAPANSTLLLFGGEGLGKKIKVSGLGSYDVLIQNSKSRFLFVVNKP